MIPSLGIMDVDDFTDYRVVVDFSRANRVDC